MSDRKKTEVTVRNRLGLHARPAMALVDLLNQFSSKVILRRSDSEELIDGKSIMQVMMLAGTQGTVIHVEAEGSDADEVIRSVEDIFERQFDEELEQS